MCIMVFNIYKTQSSNGISFSGSTLIFSSNNIIANAFVLAVSDINIVFYTEEQQTDDGYVYNIKK